MSQIKSIPVKPPASDPKIIEILHQLMERAYEYPIKSIDAKILIEYPNARIYTHFHEDIRNPET